MNTLVIATHDNNELNPSTLSAVTAAAQIGANITVLVVGHGCAGVAAQASMLSGVCRVLVADNPVFQVLIAESVASLVVGLASGYSHILASADTTSKDYMPRAAALLDVAQISEIISIEGSDTFKRPIYAGNAIATVQSFDALKVITVRSSAFEKVGVQENSAPIDVISFDGLPLLSTLVSEEKVISDRPELTTARIIVSGGRGVGSAENFALIESLADKLGAAVGASRAAVDAGFVGNDLQVGQTGKIVAPELYIAVGISGAIQHLAGMKESKVIVAINKDAEAPIFQVADYGLVGDLFQVLPEFAAKL